MWQTRPASAHYQVEISGTIGQLVNDWDTAWHAANATVNAESIGIEHANCGGPGAGWPISEATIREGGKLAGALCFVYKLGKPRYGVNVFDHRDFHSTSCPHHLAHGGKYDKAWFQAAVTMFNELSAGSPPSYEQEEKHMSPDMEHELSLIGDQICGPGRDTSGKRTFNGWQIASLTETQATRHGAATLPEMVAVTLTEVQALTKQVQAGNEAMARLMEQVTQLAHTLKED